jgi:hypothetical protein
MTHLGRLTSVLPTHKVDQGLHISRRYRAVYVQNPKAACSTIKLALQRAECGDPSYKPATSVHDKTRSPLASPSDLSAEEFQRLLREETGLPRAYERRGRKEEKPPLEEAYTPRLTRLVLEIFHRDFEAFGYPHRPTERI